MRHFGSGGTHLGVEDAGNVVNVGLGSGLISVLGGTEQEAGYSNTVVPAPKAVDDSPAIARSPTATRQTILSLASYLIEFKL